MRLDSDDTTGLYALRRVFSDRQDQKRLAAAALTRTTVPDEPSHGVISSKKRDTLQDSPRSVSAHLTPPWSAIHLPANLSQPDSSSSVQNSAVCAAAMLCLPLISAAALVTWPVFLVVCLPQRIQVGINETMCRVRSWDW